VLKQPPTPVKEDEARRHTQWDNKRALKKRREGVKKDKEEKNQGSSRGYPCYKQKISTIVHRLIHKIFT